MSNEYRVGHHQPQNVYRGDEYIGVMFDPADADLVVRTLNSAAHVDPPEFRDGDGDCWTRRSDGAYRLSLLTEWTTPSTRSSRPSEPIVTETAGQKAFRRELFNALAGRCTCGRVKNRQGNHCCRMCREGYGTHSALCRKNNPGGAS